MRPNVASAIGEIASPIIFMLFVGYQVGKYFEKITTSVIVSLIIGFLVAVFNIWKLMKRLQHHDE